MLFIDPADKSLIGAVMEYTNEQHTTSTVEVETQGFNAAIKTFRKEPNCAGLRCDVDYNSYCLVTNEMFDPWMKNMEKDPLICLRKENIRTWTWGKQKYYRLTFTAPTYHHHSNIEKAFGHDIVGETIIMTKEKYKSCKKMLQAKFSTGNE